MHKYIYFILFYFITINSALAMKVELFKSNQGELLYEISKDDEIVIYKLVEIQNAYLKKDAKLCLKLLDSWAVPEKIKRWVFIKRLKCIGFFKKSVRIQAYEESILLSKAWMPKRVTHLALEKELKVAILYLLKQYLSMGAENKALKILNKIDVTKVFTSKKDKIYLFYVKARISYSKKQFKVSKAFLKNSFFYYKKATLKSYPFSLSVFKTYSFKTLLNKRENIKTKKSIFSSLEERKAFKRLSRYSKKKQKFFNQHIQYLKQYHSSERSVFVNKSLLRAYLYLGKKKRKSFKVINKISQLKCNFLEKWVGKLFYKAGYLEIAEIYEQKNACYWSAENYFRMGVAYYYQGSYSKAKLLLSNVEKIYSGHKIVPRSLLFLAFSYIKEKEYNKAIATLKNILQHKTDFRLQAYYFLYSLYKEKQNSFKAKFYYRQLLQKYPLTYYSLKLRLLDKSLPSFFKNNINQKGYWKLHLDVEEAKSWDRVKLLLKAGWYEESRRELSLWNLPVFSSGIFIYTYLLSRSHNFLSAIKLLHYLWKEDKNFHRKALLKLLFPHFFESLVTEYALKNKLEPNLIFSLIRQESAFKVDAHSVANAYGLMQMIISTANEVKKLLGLSKKRISRHELFKPKLNIRFGSRHLRQLVKAWKGHVPLALASYNVGYGNLSRWIRARGEAFVIGKNTHFLEELWFDELPWMETSFYVKAILRNQILYKGLYEAK